MFPSLSKHCHLHSLPCRAKLDLEKKLAAEKWEAELKRVKDEKRVTAEGDAEKAAIKTLLRLLKGSEEQDEAEAASEQVALIYYCIETFCVYRIYCNHRILTGTILQSTKGTVCRGASSDRS
jgi:ribosomal protein S20